MILQNSNERNEISTMLLSKFSMTERRWEICGNRIVETGMFNRSDTIPRDILASTQRTRRSLFFRRIHNFLCRGFTTSQPLWVTTVPFLQHRQRYFRTWTSKVLFLQWWYGYVTPPATTSWKLCYLKVLLYRRMLTIKPACAFSTMVYWSWLQGEMEDRDSTAR